MIKIMIFTLITMFGIGDYISAQEEDFFAQRKNMVEYQIKARGVTNKKVLDTLLKVERHKFVPENLKRLSYEDRPLPIGEGQTISQPYIVALMTDLADISEGDRVLEIGTGSGYQAAVLAELSKEVFSIEIIPKLAKNASELLKELGYENIKVKQGDGYLGWPEYAPFDVIIVTAAPINVPEELVEQLSEGGRIVIPVGEKGGQVLKLLVKSNGKVIEKDVIPVRFVPMVKKKNEND